MVDFEDSGRGDQATELADFVEHVTVWADAGINAEAFLDRFDLHPSERQQILMGTLVFRGKPGRLAAKMHSSASKTEFRISNTPASAVRVILGHETAAQRQRIPAQSFRPL